MSNSFFVFKFWILVFNLRFCTANRFLQGWLKKNDISFTCRQFLTVLGNETEIYVSHIIAPVKPHLLKYSFELAEVVRLFLTYDIDTFDKVIGTSSVHSGCNITSDVKRSSVRFFDHSWRKVDIIKVDNARTF